MITSSSILRIENYDLKNLDLNEQFHESYSAGGKTLNTMKDIPAMCSNIMNI